MMNSQNYNSQGVARRPSQFAFFHDECQGFLHVDVLGDGVQGTATLVRCVRTGQVIVRKRTMFINDKEITPFADQFRLPHPNILQLLGFQNYVNDEGECASATYWPYANDNNLAALCQKYRKANQRVPEVLIWQCLSHLLRAYEALHDSGRSHNDGHCANVFLHWDGTSVLPEFILGDLGMCTRLPNGLGTDSDQINLHAPDLVRENDVANSAFDHILGLPTLEQLQLYDEDETQAVTGGTTMDLFCFPTALLKIGADVADVSSCISSMMFDMEFDEGCYSEELDTMAAMLYTLESFARSMHIRTMPRWKHLFTLVRYTAEQGLANAISRTSFPVQGLESFGPAPVEGRPVLFENLEDLHACDDRPPGPWNIAAVDPDTLQVVAVDRSTTYCADVSVCTGFQGDKAMSKPCSSGSSYMEEFSLTSPKQRYPCLVADLITSEGSQLFMLIILTLEAFKATVKRRYLPRSHFAYIDRVW